MGYRKDAEYAENMVYHRGAESKESCLPQTHADVFYRRGAENAEIEAFFVAAERPATKNHLSPSGLVRWTWVTTSFMYAAYAVKLGSRV